MPEIISLSAEPRLGAGKGAARATRRAGRVPAIVYGDGKEPVLISLEPRALGRVLARPALCARCRAMSNTIRSATRRCMSISCGSGLAPR